MPAKSNPIQQRQRPCLHVYGQYITNGGLRITMLQHRVYRSLVRMQCQWNVVPRGSSQAFGYCRPPTFVNGRPLPVKDSSDVFQGKHYI